MSDDQPSAKRIKLSLEPNIEQTAIDITDTGHEVHKNELSLSERLMERVDRIWRERGDWRNLSEESLERSIATASSASSAEESSASEGSSQSNLGEGQTHAMEQQLPPGFDIIKLRESVINKFFHAKSEIDVALDVINLLLAQIRPAGAHKDTPLPLPPGSIQATYVAKPRPTLKAQLETTSLTLGLKLKQQKAASAFLKSSASSLRKLVQDEQEFWEEALDLRRNHWLMQASNVPPNPNVVTATGMTGASPGLSFMVRYGYTDVGSEFGEVPFGELSRANDHEDTGGSKMRLTLPHSLPRRLVVNVSESCMSRLGLDHDMTSEVIMGMSDGDPQKATAIPPLGLCDNQKETQRQLVDAQATVFDSELYAAVLSEAQNLATSNDVRFADDQVIVTIDGQIDISIGRLQSKSITTVSNNESETVNDNQASEADGWSMQKITGRTVDLALRLLLVQRHRFNIWKNRARALCPNRKTQQILNSIAQLSSLQSNNASNASMNTSQGRRTGRIQQAGLATGQQLQSSPASTLDSLRKPYATVPVLSAVVSTCKFWVLFDRVRHMVYEVVDPLTGEGGIDLAVHYETHRLQSARGQHICEAYPSFGEIAISLSISILKGQFLLFMLHQNGNISLRLPQGLVTLNNISEFEALLTREVNLICLRMVCDVANDIIRRSPKYRAASASEQARSLWKVDDIEETINGSIWWACHAKGIAAAASNSEKEQKRFRRTIHVQLIKTRLEKNRPAYLLQFQFRAAPSQSNYPALPAVTRNVLLAKTLADDHKGEGVLTFYERVKLVVHDLVREAAATVSSD